MAQGQFVAFIDSDDSISSDFLTIPSKLNSVDVIQKSYKCIGFAGREVKVSVHNHLYDKWDKIAFLWVNKPNRALWDKIIAKKVIGDHRFIPGISISEDFLFFTSILHNIHTYAMCNIGHYNYFIRKSSAMSVFIRILMKEFVSLLNIYKLWLPSKRMKECMGFVKDLFMVFWFILFGSIVQIFQRANIVFYLICCRK